MKNYKYPLICAFLIWAFASFTFWTVNPVGQIGFGILALLLLLLVVLTMCILIYETWQKRKELNWKQVALHVGQLGLLVLGVWGDIEILLFGNDFSPLYFFTVVFLHKLEIKRDKQPEALSPAS